MGGVVMDIFKDPERVKATLAFFESPELSNFFPFIAMMRRRKDNSEEIDCFGIKELGYLDSRTLTIRLGCMPLLGVEISSGKKIQYKTFNEILKDGWVVD
jgi:hypothetical protein